MKIRPIMIVLLLLLLAACGRSNVAPSQGTWDNSTWNSTSWQ